MKAYLELYTRMELDTIKGILTNPGEPGRVGAPTSARIGGQVAFTAALRSRPSRLPQSKTSLVWIAASFRGGGRRIRSTSGCRKTMDKDRPS